MQVQNTNWGITGYYFTFLSVPLHEDKGYKQWHSGDVENEERSVDSCGPLAGLPFFLFEAKMQIQSFLQILHLFQDQQ